MKEMLNKVLRMRNAALRDARALAYLLGMSRSLRSGRLALYHARGILQHLLKKNQCESFDISQLACLSDEAFIHHCYVRAFRRVCSPSRAKHYVAVLASGTSRGEVACKISQEDDYRCQNTTDSLKKLLFLDGEQFLREAYRIILGRPIDNTGLEHYSQRLSKGEKKVRILYDLATSSEGQARRIQHPEINDFVEFLNWRGEFQRPVVLRDIMRLLTLKDDEFVQEAYRLVLRREVDATGLSVYQQALRNWISKIEILHSLAYSDEGRRFQKTLPVQLYLNFRRWFT